MTRVFQLTIADAAFTVSTPPGVEIVEDDPAYPAFLHPSGGAPDALRFPFRLKLADPVFLDRLEPVFDTGEAWKAFRHGDDVVLTIPAPAGYTGHLWVVRLARDGSVHDLHCGEALVRRLGEKTVVANALRYPLDQILMMHLLTPHRGIIVHSAGFHRDGVGAFFAGVSGAGKSTLTELVAGRDDLSPLSDDRVVVRKTADGIRLYGTPWPGEAGVAVNESARLGAVVVLRQARHHGLRELSPREALERLLPTVSILWYDEELTTAALAWIDELLREVPAYELSFRRDEGVAETVDELFSRISG